MKRETREVLCELYISVQTSVCSRRKAELQTWCNSEETCSRHHVIFSPVTYAPPVINITHHDSVAVSRGGHNNYPLYMNDSGLGFSGDAALTRELSSGSLNDFMAPVFGTNGPRTNAKDVDLNEVFSEFFLMSEFEGLGGKNAGGEALDADTIDGAEDLGCVDDADHESAHLEVGGGELGEKRRATRGANAHASGSSSNNGNGSESGTYTLASSRTRRTTAGVTKARDSPSKSKTNSALPPTTSSALPPPTSSSSTTPPLPTSPPSPTEAAAPAPKTKPPRAQPSGFAGISAITRRGNDGNLSVITVKTETSQHPPKKRRRRPDPASMTDEQRVDRRERNREHAKRSRVRKKFLLESLQEQLLGLRGENTGLRKLVVDKCPAQKADGILKNCMTEENFLLLESDLRLAAEETGGRAARQSNNASGGDAAAASGGGAPSRQNTSRGLPDGVGGPDRSLTVPDYRLMLSLVNAQQNFTVSDPGLPDNPIVYASQGFLDLTGYSREQVLGRNCRFLQGPKTNPKMVDVIRKGVAAGDDTSVCLLNYKADGTTFWNQFFVAALRDLDGRVVNYVGVQCEVEESLAKQLPGMEKGAEEATGMPPPAPVQSFTNS